MRITPIGLCIWTQSSPDRTVWRRPRGMALLKVEYYRDLGFAILRTYTNSSISLPPTYGLDVSFRLLCFRNRAVCLLPASLHYNHAFTVWNLKQNFSYMRFFALVMISLFDNGEIIKTNWRTFPILLSWGWVYHYFWGVFHGGSKRMWLIFDSNIFVYVFLVVNWDY